MLAPPAGLPSRPPSRPRKASRALEPLSSRPNPGAARLAGVSEPPGRPREADGAASSIWPRAVALGSVSSWCTSGGAGGVRWRAAGAGWAQLGEVSNCDSRPPLDGGAGASEAIMSRLSARLLDE